MSWITILFLSAENFERWITFLSHSVENLLAKIHNIISTVGKNHDIILQCRKFCGVNYNFVPLQKILWRKSQFYLSVSKIFKIFENCVENFDQLKWSKILWRRFEVTILSLSVENFVRWSTILSHSVEILWSEWQFCTISKMSHSGEYFVEWITILSHSVENFVSKITISSHSVGNFVRWSTILSHSVENFVEWITFLSHSVEKFVRWITILSHSPEILRGELQYYNFLLLSQCHTIYELNNNFVSQCRKIWEVDNIFVSQYRKFWEVNNFLRWIIFCLTVSKNLWR